MIKAYSLRYLYTIEGRVMFRIMSSRLFVCLMFAPFSPLWPESTRRNVYSHLWQVRLSQFNMSGFVGYPLTLELIRYSICLNSIDVYFCEETSQCNIFHRANSRTFRKQNFASVSDTLGLLADESEWMSN